MQRNIALFLRTHKAGRVRIILTLFFTLSGILFIGTLLGSTHPAAYASPPTIRETALPTSLPWGVAFDTSNNVWVAEPGCDPAPACSPQVGSIARYNRQSFTLVQNYTEPAGYSSPLFLAVDKRGHVWFTEPSTDALGELTVTNGIASWQQWTLPTPNATPYDLTFDVAGNLWFTEFTASSIGEFIPATQHFIETPTPTPDSEPYGITGPDTGPGTIWFTENNRSVAQIGSFVPPLTSALHSGNINEYLTKARNIGTPHLITLDKRGHVWWTEGWDGDIASLALAQARPGTSNGVNEYAVPPPNCQPGPNCGTHISGIAVDSSGTLWFDDSLSSRIGSYVPGSNTFAIFVVGGGTTSNAHPHDGLAIDANNTLWFTEEFASKLGQAVPVQTANKPPVNRRWYFANGRVGHGATESLALVNPAATTRCAVTVQYLYKPAGGRQTSKTLTVIVPPAARVSRSVNSDLNYPAYRARSASVSTVVRVNAAAMPACTGIAAHVFQQHYSR